MVASSKKILASVLCAALAGCATVTSSNVAVRADPTAEAAGLTYFLPMRMMKFTATRMTMSKLKKAVQVAEAGVVKAKEAKTKADKALKEAKEKLAAATGADAEKLKLQVAELEGKAAEAAAAVKVAEGVVQSATTALDDAGAAGAPCTYTAQLIRMEPQADPHFRYVARMNHSGLRDDHMELKLTAAGLLTSGNVTATDHTGDILVEAIAAATALGGKALTGPSTAMLGDRNPASAAESDKPPARCETLPPTFQYVFDPVAENSIRDLNMALVDAEFPFSVQMNDLSPEVSEQSAGATAWATFTNTGGNRRAKADAAAGIYYRTATPVIFALNRTLTIDADKNPNPCVEKLAKLRNAAADATAVPGVAFDRCVVAAASWQPIDTVLTTIPQAGPVSFIPMTATAFVKSTDDVAFTDGSVTSWTRDRPSEVMAVVKLPAALIGRISELLSLRVTYTTNTKTLADKQREEIQADVRWRVFEDCVRDARAKQTPVDACFPK